MRLDGVGVKRILFLLAAVGIALGTAPAAAPAKGRTPVAVKPTNPFYPVLEAFAEGTVEVGAIIGGCRLEPFAQCPGAELDRGKLTGAIVTSSDLRRLHAAHAKLAGATFSLSRLEGADLRQVRAAALVASYAHLDRADLSGADLTLGGLAEMRAREANLRKANLFSADLSGADLRGAGLRDAFLFGTLAAGADLRGADLRGANLTFADLHRADLRGARLAGAKFCDTIMPDGHLRDRRHTCPAPSKHPRGPTISIPPGAAPYTVLKESGEAPQLPGARIHGCVIAPSSVCPDGNLRGAHIRAAFLSYARFLGANFRGADLALGNLSFARLRGADFRRAVLAGSAGVGADFSLSDMSHADMTLADLVGASLRDVKLRGADARDSNLTRASLRGADLRNARLGSAALAGTDLRKARFGGTDLSEAVLSGARVDVAFPAGATLCNTVMPDGSVANRQADCSER